MKKIIKPSDWLLLGLAGFFEILQDIKDPFDLFKNYYQNFYGEVPARWQKVNFYHLVWRNLKVGNIVKKVVGGKVYLEVTAKGKEKIKERFPLINLISQDWDGKIRFAIYDIEEENKIIRELFRKKVKQLGFGMLQKSVWITPHNLLEEFQEFLQAHRLTEKVILLETENFYIGDLKKLAKKVWQIDKIALLYKELYKDLLLYKSLIKKGDRNQKINSLKKRLREKVIKVYFQDPFLPDEFLPQNWIGKKVREAVKEVKIFQ